MTAIETRKEIKKLIEAKGLKNIINRDLTEIHDRTGASYTMMQNALNIVENGNFGTRRKYADFTEGKKKAGLHPMQIVFTSIELAQLMHDRYIDGNDQVRTF